MGKMSEIHYDGSSFVSLSNDLRNYPEHYTAAHDAANRIDYLQKRVADLEEVVARLLRGDRYEHKTEEGVSAAADDDVLNAAVRMMNANVEGKDE